MIKRLAKIIGEYKRDAILAPVFIAMEVAMEVIIPLIMADLIDNGVAQGQMPVVLRTGLALFFSALIALSFGVLSGRFAARSAAGFAKNLRKALYHNIQEFSFSNIDKYSTAGLVTRLTTDVTNLQNAFQMLIRIAVRAPAMIILSLLSAFSIHARLSLIFIVFLPLLGGGLFLIARAVRPIIQRAIQLYDKLNSVVQENLRGIRVVKSFVRDRYETQKFEQVSGNIFKDFVTAEKMIAFTGPLMQFCMYGCTLLISWFGAQFILGGSLTTGELMGLITYITQILMNLMVFSMVLIMLVISRASAQRIDEVLTETTDISSKAAAIPQVADGAVVFEDVSFSYAGDQTKLCLEGISLTIRPGETVGILGGTGSGKSTLVQLIPRLYDATRGVVRVGGVNVRDYSLEALRNSVAMVLQNNQLFSGTVKENLRWGNRQATDQQLVWACRLAQADDFVRELPDGYDTYLEQGGANLSGGQKQRLCIARALLKNPKILVLDDSTSAVDTKTDALIRQAFREELPHVTKIIIAQRVASIQHADKIVVLDNGRLDAIGTHQQLLQSSAIYQEVHQSQTRGDSIHAK